jgi:hypothetical protein
MKRGDKIKRYGALSLGFGIFSVFFSWVMSGAAYVTWSGCFMFTCHKKDIGEYILAMVLTIAACFPIVVALIFGILRLRNKDIKDGRGMAVTGICLALIVPVFWLILLVGRWVEPLIDFKRKGAEVFPL